VGQHHGFVRFAEYFLLLDSGLRRKDGPMDYLSLIHSMPMPLASDA